MKKLYLFGIAILSQLVATQNALGQEGSGFIPTANEVAAIPKEKSWYQNFAFLSENILYVSIIGGIIIIALVFLIIKRKKSATNAQTADQTETRKPNPPQDNPPATPTTTPPTDAPGTPPSNPPTQAPNNPPANNPNNPPEAQQ